MTCVAQLTAAVQLVELFVFFFSDVDAGHVPRLQHIGSGRMLKSETAPAGVACFPVSNSFLSFLGSESPPQVAGMLLAAVDSQLLAVQKKLSFFPSSCSCFVVAVATQLQSFRDSYLVTHVCASLN
jgi:hypothetical protein